jgi:hypothetical protein
MHFPNFVEILQFSDQALELGSMSFPKGIESESRKGPKRSCNMRERNSALTAIAKRNISTPNKQHLETENALLSLLISTSIVTKSTIEATSKADPAIRVSDSLLVT